MYFFAKCRVKALLIYSVIGSAFIVTGCGPTAPPSSPGPQWLKAEERIDPEYLYGFAKVEKRGKRSEYVAECNNMALGNIAQSISVQVRVESQRKVQELEKKGDRDFYALEKSFEMISAVRSQMTLRGVEHVGEWEDIRFYYVYKRLSIDEYNKELMTRVKNALESAMRDYAEGHEWIAIDPVRSLSYFFSAYRSLAPYQDQLLLSIDPVHGGEVNLDVEVKGIIKDMIQRFRIETGNNRFSARVGGPVNGQLEAKVFLVDQDGSDIPVKELPIRFSFDKGYGKLGEMVKSDENGIAVTNVSRVGSPERNQSIRAELDLIEFAYNDDIGKMIVADFSSLSLPYGQFILDVELPTVYMESKEFSLGVPLHDYIVTPAVIKSLKENIGFTFVDVPEEADYTLELNVSTQKLAESYGLFTSTAQLNMYFREAGTIVFAYHEDNIRGTHTNYELAAVNALQRLSDKVEEEIGAKIAQEFFN